MRTYGMFSMIKFQIYVLKEFNENELNCYLLKIFTNSKNGTNANDHSWFVMSLTLVWLQITDHHSDCQHFNKNYKKKKSQRDKNISMTQNTSRGKRFTGKKTNRHLRRNHNRRKRISKITCSIWVPAKQESNFEISSEYLLNYIIVHLK